ncbi:MAG: hypothetical protein Q8L14_31050 [Myxococcales bacterium]|nr:hypothetical protein [Myxococcales bacterium]
MWRAFLVMAIVTVMSGCPGTVSPQPVQGRTTVEKNTTYFWKVASSTLEWGTCSDAEDFRASVSALPFGMNSFLIYKTDPEGKTAKAQTCTSLDPSTCSDSNSGIVFVVGGTELTFVRDLLKEPLRVRDTTGMERDSTCSLTQLETWTMRDNGPKFELDVTNSLGLVADTADGGAECDLIENSLISRSPNMAGVRGCIINFKLAGDLR